MKRTVISSGTLFLVMIFALLPVAVYAQQGGNPVFELKKFYIDQPKSPSAADKSFSYTENSENWLQVVCEFEVTDTEGWLDNVTFKWHLHLLGAETERLVLSKSITYDGLEADGKTVQRCVVYLSPRDIRRFYSSRNASIGQSKVIAHIEIIADGIKVGEFQFPKGKVRGVPPQWWNSRQVNRKENVLLSRIESPWFGMDYDTWLPERPSEKPVAR